MMHNPNHDNGIGHLVDKWQGVNISSYIANARISTQTRPCLLKKGTRIIYQDHFVVSLILIRHTTEARTNFDQAFSMRRKQTPEGQALGQVFVVSAFSFPEVCAVRASLVITNDRPRAHSDTYQ